MRRILAFIAILLFCGTAAANGIFGSGTVASSSGGSSSPVVVVCQSGTPVSTNGVVTFGMTLATCTVPANLLGPNGFLKIFTQWSAPNSSTYKFPQVLWGATLLDQYYWNGTNGYALTLQIANQGVTNSQMTTNVSNGTLSYTQTSLDTTQPQTISFTGGNRLGTAIATTAVSANGTYCTATVASGAYPTGDFVYAAGITMSGTSASCANVGTSSSSTVSVTNISSTQFEYPCSCASGTSATTQGTVQDITPITLSGYQVIAYPHN